MGEFFWGKKNELKKIKEKKKKIALKFFWIKKKFGSEIVLGQKKFGSEFFLGKKRFGSEFFLESNNSYLVLYDLFVFCCCFVCTQFTADLNNNNTEFDLGGGGGWVG